MLAVYVLLLHQAAIYFHFFITRIHITEQKNGQAGTFTNASRTA